MNFETLKYEMDDNIAIVTLNRPERLNAISREMAIELGELWDSVKRDPEVAVVVLTGAGEKSLCTGVDVTSVSEKGGFDRKAPPTEEPPFLRMTPIQKKCWKPVIAAVNGMVCGGGFHFIADCDIVIAADHATFFDTHVRSGTLAGLEPVSLARRIPFEAVMRLSLMGGSERMGADEALRLGMVGEVVPMAELLPRAIEVAKKIAAHSPTALARTKQTLYESLDLGLEDALANTWKMISLHTTHPDQAEGPRARMQKREPNWGPYDPDATPHSFADSAKVNK